MQGTTANSLAKNKHRSMKTKIRTIVRSPAHRPSSSPYARLMSFSLLLGWLLMAAGPLSAAGIIGGQLFATGGNVTVEVLPASAGYTSELHLISPGPDRFIALNHDVGTVVNLGSFTAGVELVFGIYVRDTGDTFRMGPASRNPDGIEHAGVDNTAPGVAIVGFEDLLGGGDLDYDDNVFKFTGGIAPLGCPADVSVPTDPGLASAVVNYTAPTVSGATVTCVPSSGTAFPVGSTAVTCTANYTRGDVVTCSFNITVLPGRGVKESVLADVIALRATVTDPKDLTLLDEVLDDLSESLLPALWVDQLHVDRRRGDVVFQEEREAAKILCLLIKKNNSHIPTSLLQGFINRMLQVDRALASVAIDEAVLAGVSAKKIEQARKFLAKGDAEARGDKCYKAFDFYRIAWKLAGR